MPTNKMRVLLDVPWCVGKLYFSGRRVIPDRRGVIIDRAPSIWAIMVASSNHISGLWVVVQVTRVGIHSYCGTNGLAMSEFHHTTSRHLRAVGSTMARFFHPSKKICEQWPNDDKRHCPSPSDR